MPNVSATSRSWCCAISNGFSRRWDTGAAAAIGARCYLIVNFAFARVGFASSGSVGHAASRSS